MHKHITPLNKDQQKYAVDLYAALMEEVKQRFDAIHAGMGTVRALILPHFASEFCILQIRMICEIIAMACLVAHGDITAGRSFKRLRNEWRADQIMKELDALHPHFFPRAIKMTVVPATAGEPHGIHLDDRPGQLTKSEFLALYGRTGDALHRGTINKITGKKAFRETGDAQITEWSNRLIHLLNDHRIASWDNLRHFLCVMRSLEHGGRAIVSFAEAPAGTTVEEGQSLFPDK